MSRQAPSPYPNGESLSFTTALAHSHVSQALLTSPDGGQTLDFSHKNLTEIPENSVKELLAAGRNDADDSNAVLRIAFNYNRLRTLPLSFYLLGKLRYLNLRSNSFTTFPEVLTNMASLEILDLTRNNIKQLPAIPGSLVNLQVFSLSKNRITRLPPYLSDFQSLSVLKVDHNPIEWPPADVVGYPEEFAQPDGMRDWVDTLRAWLRDAQNVEKRHKELVSSISTPETENSDEESVLPVFGLRAIDAMVKREAHTRNPSIDSIASSQYSSDFGYSDFMQAHADHQGFSSRSVSSSPAPFEPQKVSSQEPETPKDALSQSTSALHARNASYSPAGLLHTRRTGLTIKKSLPDLRTIRQASVADSADRPSHSRSAQKSLQIDLPSKRNVTRKRPSPTHAQPSNHQHQFQHPPPLPQPLALGPPYGMEHEGPPSFTSERNSYFRRLSLHQHQGSSVVPLPASLSSLIDAIRGIYFAIHQIYDHVRHYTVSGLDDRFSGALAKVLSSSTLHMGQMTVNLDRFDSCASKGLPPPNVIRHVFESCRENVAGCFRVMGALQLQLKVLASYDDVRYTRTLVLMLYGSVAEISHAWQSITRLLPEVQPYLKEPRALKSLNGWTSEKEAAVAEALDASASSISGRPVGTLPNGRARQNRRHAGSFSIKDVELGRSLPSHTEHSRSATSGAIESPLPPVPPLSISAGHTPLKSTTRATLHATETAAGQALSDHSRDHSRVPSPLPPLPSRNEPPTFSSPSLSQLPLGGMSPHRKNIARLELPSDSSRSIDQELLETMESTVEAAQTFWQMVADVAANAPALETSPQLLLNLENASRTTSQLADNIREVKTNPNPRHGKALFECAYSFIKMVTQISTDLKAFGLSYSLPTAIRSAAAKLAQSTKDIAVLLNASSYSSSGSSRTFSPAPFEGQGQASLSRSRSAQPAGTFKPPPFTASQDAPWSAMPHQNFKLPNSHPSLPRPRRTDSHDLNGP
ncbi:hypothetical protein SISSUDRAFT_1039351 [Sistotremastrum suecicum HHB10207 ss-3]|uniref:L domain-like protein n=1 Tax=Sistotremastrum suecicum HHB10207 ss-3 TaxID=1314776 RepID=A0A166IUA3_9AGAM|nr:hypothetical protein SISSUDRAFT_1039351 [Sistotremastrum suecicum HHB10207 ss-3]